MKEVLIELLCDMVENWSLIIGIIIVGLIFGIFVIPWMEQQEQESYIHAQAYVVSSPVIRNGRYTAKVVYAGWESDNQDPSLIVDIKGYSRIVKLVLHNSKNDTSPAMRRMFNLTKTGQTITFFLKNKCIIFWQQEKIP